MGAPGEEHRPSDAVPPPPPPPPAPVAAPVAAWYPDPARRYQYRYWDGTAWTGNVATNGVTSWDPPYADRPGATAAVAPPGMGSAPVAPPPAVPLRDRSTLRSTSSLATAFGWILGITAGALIARLAAAIYRMAAVGAAESWDESRDPAPIIRRLQTADDLSYITYALLALLFIAVFVLLIIWMFRSARNARRLDRWDNLLGPGWTIGGWFIPFAGWVIPATLMQSIWRSAEPVAPVRGPGRRRSAAVGLWWICFLAGMVAVMIGMSADTETARNAQDLYNVDTANVVSCVLLFTSCLTLRGTVLAVQRRTAALADPHASATY